VISQADTGDLSHKPNSRLTLLSASLRPTCGYLPRFTALPLSIYSKFAVKRLSRILPYLTYVATLPCEVFGSLNCRV